MRVLALWSPDWPVTAAARAAHIPAHRPAAVLAGNRVLACSAVARAQGVRRGLRRREAQARCPELAVLTRDPDRDARAFEPVVVATEELAPGVEIVRPGLVVLPARGPAGYFGGELAAAERLVDQVAARTGVECQVGVADGLFAAVLAARRGLAVAAGDTPAFLAPLGVEELDAEPDVDRSELVGLLRRLGLRSLGAFGALDPEDVASRFGADAVLCHRLARGQDPRPPVRRRPPEELTVEIELDPPVDRVDAAAFAARGLAERLHRTLAGHGLSCTRLGVAARTVSGAELHRVWRCAEPLTPAGTVDRVRWQLDAWLTRRRSAAEGGPGAVARLWLIPEETVTAGALQLGLWGEVGEADERAGRALVRVQAMLGPESVFTAVLTGGRDPGERVRLVPWGDERGAGEDIEPGPITDRAPGTDEQPRARVGLRVVADPAPIGPALPVESPPVESPPVESPPVEALPADPRAVPRPARSDPAAPAVDLDRLLPTVGDARIAPAGWPQDVVRRTGRISAADVLAAAPPGCPMDLSVTSLSHPAVPSTPPPESAADPPPPHPRPAGPSEPPRPRPTNRKRRPPARPSRSTRPLPDPPASWPGRLPAPSPATVPPEPLPAELLDAAGRPVWLARSDQLSADPHRLVIDGGAARTIEGWAGPWPVRQRWWSPDAVTASRLQLLCPEGDAFLLIHRDGRWWISGIYD
jgi:protein ImuB